MKPLEPPPPNPSRQHTGAWWLVLCLVGIDYFSALAYVPSLANEIAGPLAPFAILGVVLVTFLLALPAYLYVVGRSFDGRGATGLIQRSITGWRGKFLILVMMGFVAADFIITRSLSTSDAAVHLLANPQFDPLVDQHSPALDDLKRFLPQSLADKLAPYWNRQVGVTLVLSVFSMILWFYFAGGLGRKRVLWLSATVVLLYMTTTLFVLIRCSVEVFNQPSLWHNWWQKVDLNGATKIESAVLLLLLIFPQLALGISGFELSMTVVPLISGDPGDDQQRHKQRIRRSRFMLVALTIIMGVFLLAATQITTMMIPEWAFGSEKQARHRALAYLVHGPLFPTWFGTAYDLITASILCLAGVSVTVGLRDLVPEYLHRLGMEMTWARKFGLFLLLCNVVILLATLVFRASVENQEGAYATSVLILLTGANLAAAADLRKRFPRAWPFLTFPFISGLLFFLTMAGIMIYRQPGGLILSLAFLVIVFLTSIWSRWRRSLELRFTGFTFADDRTKARWQELCGIDYEILVPHRPGHFSVFKKDEVVREKFRIPANVPIIFIEVELGDTSEFHHQPFMRIDTDQDLEVIRVSKCASVAHVIAAVALEFSKVGKPPEVFFGWSHKTPLAANLNFLLLGQGNIPWMVQELIHRAEPTESKRPRIVIG